MGLASIWLASSSTSEASPTYMRRIRIVFRASSEHFSGPGLPSARRETPKGAQHAVARSRTTEGSGEARVDGMSLGLTRGGADDPGGHGCPSTREGHEQHEPVFGFEALERHEEHRLSRAHHGLEAAFPGQHSRARGVTGLLEAEHRGHLPGYIYPYRFVPWSVPGIDVAHKRVASPGQGPGRDEDEQRRGPEK